MTVSEGKAFSDVDLDVAIIGGGPGGLATAAALLSAAQSGMRVKVRLL